MFPGGSIMTASSGPTYEVLALRYGIFDGRLQYQNFIIPDDHAAPDPLDFYVFAIRGADRTARDAGHGSTSPAADGDETDASIRDRHAALGHMSADGDAFFEIQLHRRRDAVLDDDRFRRRHAALPARHEHRVDAHLVGLVAMRPAPAT